jgi:hypothetical protein
MSEMIRTRLFPAACAACLLLSLAPPLRADGPAELLSLVPSDAWGFVMARSLDGVDEKAKQLKEALDLPFETPVTPMALGMLELGDTIDPTRPICAILLDFQKFGQNAAVLLVPAREPEALLKQLSAEEAVEGVSKCTVMGEPGFAAVKGKVVIFGASEDCVTKVAKTKKTASKGISRVRSEAIAGSDLYLSLSAGAVVGAYKEQFLPMIQMMAGPSGAGASDIEKFVKILEEIAALDFSFTFDAKGFRLAMLMTPRGETDLAKMLAEEKNTSDALLGLLPQEKYLFAMGGVDSQGEEKRKLGGDKPASGVLKMLQLGELDEESLKGVDTAIVKLQRSVRRYATSLSALGGGSEGLFGAAMVVETNDAPEFLEGARKLFKAVWEISEDEDFQSARKSIVHAPDAETLAGHKVDTITVDLEGLARLAEADTEESKRMETIFGKECVVRFSAVDDTHFVLSWGGGKKRFETICGSLKSGGEKLSADEGIREVSGGLPSPRGGEAFFAVDHILQTVKSMVKAFGEEEEFPFDIPTVNAPVAFSSAVQDKVARVDIMIPMKLIKAGKAAYDQYAEKAGEEDFDDEEESPAEKKQTGKAPAKPEEKPAEDDASEEETEE